MSIPAYFSKDSGYGRRHRPEYLHEYRIVAPPMRLLYSPLQEGILAPGRGGNLGETIGTPGKCMKMAYIERLQTMTYRLSRRGFAPMTKQSNRWL